MEQNFQTSFIPKKPIVESETTTRTPPRMGLFTIISIFLFIISAVVAGGFYLYEKKLAQDILKLDQDQTKSNERFEESKKNELALFDKRLQVANSLLNKHIAVSPIFETLSKVTLKSIRYTKFSYENDVEKNGLIKIKLSGVTKLYMDIALQADVFNSEKNFIDPVFLNMLPNDKGDITFDLEFYVDPAFVDYKEVIKFNQEETFDTGSSGAGSILPTLPSQN